MVCIAIIFFSFYHVCIDVYFDSSMCSVDMYVCGRVYIGEFFKLYWLWKQNLEYSSIIIYNFILI